MNNVAIVSPFDIWCRGMSGLLAELGWKVAVRCSSAEQAFTSPLLARVDLLIISRCLLPAREGDTSQRPFCSVYDGPIIVVVEPEEITPCLPLVTSKIDGLIVSTTRMQKFKECLVSVHQGTMWVDEFIYSDTGDGHGNRHGISTLSKREFEIARLAASGLSNKQIARMLDISDGTIKIHMHHILGKLNLKSRMALGYSEPELLAGPAETLANQALPDLPLHRNASHL